MDFYIKPLSDEAAFNKGVEYFVEFVFFYGVLIVIAVGEVKKSQESSDKLKGDLKMLQTSTTNNGQIAEDLVAKIQELSREKSRRD